MSKERPSTRAVLLDVAERLFAEHGFDGTSLRMIAAAAETNLGAVNYHFATKQGLYAETFLRRFRPVNVERNRLITLARQEAGSGALPLERVLDCLLRPAYDLAREHPVFAALLGRNLIAPPAFFREIIHEDMEFIARTFGPELLRSVPNISPERALLRLHLCAGSLLFMAAVPTPTLDIAGDQGHQGPQASYGELLAFTTAGFLAGLTSQAP